MFTWLVKSATGPAITVIRWVFHKRKKTSHQVLDMTVNVRWNSSNIFREFNTKLQTIKDVGLGYVTLGQPATTLSGESAMKLASELHLNARQVNPSIFWMSRQAKGLNTEDIARLLRFSSLRRRWLILSLVIGHNLDVSRRQTTYHRFGT